MSLGKIPEEKAELYERSSWRVVGELKNDLVVLTTDDPDAPEIFSEPEHLIKPLKRLAKKHTAYWILFLIMFMLSRVGSPFMYSMLGMATFVEGILDIGTAYYILLCLMAVLLLLEFVVHLRSCRHLKKLIKHIERGGELPTGEHYKAKSKIGAVLILLTIPVIILWFVHLAIPMGEVYLHGTNDLSGLPFPTMQEINIDEYNYYVDGLKKVEGASLANISKSHDLLAPTMIDFSQDCSLFENITGEDDTRQWLIMRFGSKYIRVSYSGSSDLGEYTDLYITKLKA